MDCVAVNVATGTGEKGSDGFHVLIGLTVPTPPPSALAPNLFWFVAFLDSATALAARIFASRNNSAAEAAEAKGTGVGARADTGEEAKLAKGLAVVGKEADEACLFVMLGWLLLLVVGPLPSNSSSW